MIFETRGDFREWLGENHNNSGGVWLLFGKKGGPQTLSANDALEEALCFGWIDGQMKKIDDNSYRKYFAPRRVNSKWSLKNKELAKQLIRAGSMTAAGLQQIQAAKGNGQWDKATRPADIAPEQIAQVATLLGESPLAVENFRKMSPSVQKTYTRAYFDAKTPAGQVKRLAWMIDRLERNLRPM